MPARGADILEQSVQIAVSMPAPADARLAAWRERPAKIRWPVPTTLPDLVKTDEVLGHEYHEFAAVTEQARAVSTERLATRASRDRHRGLQPAAGLGGVRPRRRPAGLAAPAGASSWSRSSRCWTSSTRPAGSSTTRGQPVPMTIFGPQRAAVYMGNLYFVYNTTEHVLTRHFDGLMGRAAAAGDPRLGRGPARRGRMIAGLPMYDLEEVRWAHARAAAARPLSTCAPRLDGGDTAQWQAPDLLLSQTCGHPLRQALAGRVAYAATLLRGARLQRRNIFQRHRRAPGRRRHRLLPGRQRRPWSGRFALERAFATRPSRRRSGPVHAASVAAVASGAADVAAIDAVTLALLTQHRPAAVAGVWVLQYTAPAPALPYVTRPGGPVAALRRALRDVVADPALADAPGAAAGRRRGGCGGYAVMDDAREALEA